MTDTIWHGPGGARTITGLVTLQFSWGGLFDGQPADGYRVHLVRRATGGTPGPTLCGIDRFAEDSPGWSVGGGCSGPGITHPPCDGCTAEAVAHYRGLPIHGLAAAEIIEAIINIEEAGQR